MSFDYTIKADPSQALQASDQVVRSLDGIESKASQTGGAITRAFGADKMKDASGRFLATGVAAQQLHDRVMGVANASDAFTARLKQGTAALERERTILDGLRGPQQRYMENTQALASLHAKGLINAQEYNRELKKIESSLAASKGGGDSGAFRKGAGAVISNVGIPGGGALGGLVASSGPAAALAATAVAGVAAVKTLAEVGDEWTRLHNRLRVVAGSQNEVNNLFGDLHGVAIKTRSALDTTIEGFVKLKFATKEMGVSNSHLLEFTEHLNKAIKVSGASGSEASAGMQQLSQGLASGRLQGDELRSVLENLPYVADIIAKSMGKTRGELRKMGEEGKISAQVVMDAFDKAGGEIDESFAKTVPTVSESWQMLKDKVFVALGEGLENSGLLQKLPHIIDQVGSVIEKVAEAFGYIMQGISAVGDFLDDVANGGENMFAGQKNAFKQGMGLDTGPAMDYTKVIQQTNDMLIQQSKQYEKNRVVTDALTAAKKAGLSVPIWDEANANAADRMKIQLKNAGVIVGETMSDARTYAQALVAKMKELDQQHFSEKVNREAKQVWESEHRINSVLEEQHKKRQQLVDDVKNLQTAVEMNAFGAELRKRLGATTQSDIDLARKSAAGTYAEGLKDEAGSNAAIKARETTQQQANAVEDLNAAYAKHRVNAQQYMRDLEAIGGEAARWIKIWKDLNEPTQEFHKNLAILDGMLKRGSASAAGYTRELEKLYSAASSLDIGEFTKVADRLTKLLDAGKLNTQAYNIAFGQIASASGVQGLNDMYKVTLELQEMLRTGVITLEDYNAELAQLAALAGNPDLAKLRAYNFGAPPDLSKELDRFKQTHDPKDQKKPNGLDAWDEHSEQVLEANVKRTDEWNKKLREVIDSEDVALQSLKGLHEGLKGIKDEVSDISGLISGSITNAFKGLEDNIIEAFRNGQMAWGDLARQIEADLIRIAIRMIAMRLISSFGGSSSGAVTGAASGMSPSDIAAGGSHAYGGSYKVGGVGGSDSQPFLMRLSPGERVTFQPEGQQMNAGKDYNGGGSKGGGGGSREEIHIHNRFDPRDLGGYLGTYEGKRAVYNVIRNPKMRKMAR